jgi:hypothetical protein
MPLALIGLVGSVWGARQWACPPLYYATIEPATDMPGWAATRPRIGRNVPVQLSAVAHAIPEVREV